LNRFRKGKSKQERIDQLLEQTDSFDSSKLDDTSLVEDLTPQPSPKEHNLKRFPQVPCILMEADQGSIFITKSKQISSEIVKSPDEKDDYYTGLEPTLVRIDRNIFPKRVQRWFAPYISAKGFFKIKHEPCMRNPFNGTIVDQTKKKNTLIEKGVMDQQGFMLDKSTGNRMVIEDHWVKVDWSDIDYMKAEYHEFLQSKAIEHANAAMAKTGSGYEDILRWIVIASFIMVGFIVFIMSGGI
jgi:hypothetical protein